MEPPGLFTLRFRMSIRGVQKRYTISVEVEVAVANTHRIAFRLIENAPGSKLFFLRFNNADDF
jgi:hypothetical protein